MAGIVRGIETPFGGMHVHSKKDFMVITRNLERHNFVDTSYHVRLDLAEKKVRDLLAECGSREIYLVDLNTNEITDYTRPATTLELRIRVVSGGARPRVLGSVWRPCLEVDRETTPHGTERIKVRLTEGCTVKMTNGTTRHIYDMDHEIWVYEHELRKKEDK